MLHVREAVLCLTVFVVLVSLAYAEPNVVKVLEVPYINQKYDVPEWFDGRYSCGPTCVAMVLAYYGVLPPWPLNCSKPFPHESLYGKYIVCKFKVGDFVFDERQPDASRMHYGYGIHGYVYEPGVGAVWSKIVELFKLFGFEAYVDTTPMWEELVAEINAGRPVILGTEITSSGHLVVAVGYTSDKGVVVNDPAGDKSLGYFNYNGAKVIYDWPGVNNGRVNLKKIKVFITVRPTKHLKKAEPIEPCKPEGLENYMPVYIFLAVSLVISIIVGLIVIKKEYSKIYSQNKQ
ncbi:MAG: hypothetical protein DRN04_09505 [Thermoprotei archaeon]|nr:MAG: hypothetical protein DRN04_09505 [Thermoprotei archaeon]